MDPLLLWTREVVECPAADGRRTGIIRGCRVYRQQEGDSKWWVVGGKWQRVGEDGARTGGSRAVMMAVMRDAVVLGSDAEGVRRGGGSARQQRQRARTDGRP